MYIAHTKYTFIFHEYAHVILNVTKKEVLDYDHNLCFISIKKH